MENVEYTTVPPLGMKIGDLPSGPPPTGMVVLLLANRALPGTDGYRRRAFLREQEYDLIDLGLKLTFVQNKLQILHVS